FIAVGSSAASALSALRLVGAIRALHAAVGARAGFRHLLPASAMVVAARRGALHRVHGALGRLPPDLLGGALDALGQEIAEALPVADHLDEPVGAFDVAPPELEADLLLRQIALLHAFHDP